MSSPNTMLCTQALLVDLERHLIGLDLWSQTTPSDEAMASEAPFACDTMPFEQWLQFIFLPRMHILVEKEQPLPSSIAIAPMAEYHFGDAPKFADLIALLARIDFYLTTQELD